MRIYAWWLIPASAILVACGSTAPSAGRPVSGTYFPADGDGYLHITAVAPGYAGRDPADRRWFIYLEGYIDTGATTRLARTIGRERIGGAVVYFDSPGGHVLEAMELGRLLRARHYSASVGARLPSGAAPRAGRCFSACPIAFAGGVSRSLEPGSVLGLHRAENSVPVPDESAFQGVVTGQLKDYLAQMGIGWDLVTIMAAVPNDTIRELTADEAVKLGLVNAGASTMEPR